MIEFVRLSRVDSPTLTRVLRQAAMQSLALLMVMGLALTSLAPMLDHHFAERHAGHQHLYLGQASPTTPTPTSIPTPMTERGCTARWPR